MQPESEEGIRHLSQESLEERSQLHRVLVGQIDVGSILVESFRDLLESTDISILSENTFHSHILLSALACWAGKEAYPFVAW